MFVPVCIPRLARLGGAIGAALGLLACLSASAKVVYVNKNATGVSHDGTSWLTAFLTVQDGVNAAISGDEVWIACSAPAAPAYVENASVGPGVALYGGFAGKEAERAQRDWTANATVLAGASPDGAVLSTSRLEYYTGAVTIDGFVIRSGHTGVDVSPYLPGTSQASIANCTISGHATGITTGSHNAGLEMTIVGCILSDNSIGVSPSNTTATVYNSTISGNSSFGVNANGGSTSLRDCVISDNPCGLYAMFGLISISNSQISGSTSYGASVELESYLSATNCVFNGNTIAVLSRSSTGLTNCTICGNGTGLEIDVPGGAALANSIVAYNDVAVAAQIYSTPYVKLSNSDIYGNASADFKGVPDPTGTSGNISLDPRFTSGAAAWRLSIGSPCIDSGDDGAVTPGETDKDGKPRIIGAHVDIGAYEYGFPAVQCGFARQPGGGPASSPLPTQPVVQITDGLGDTTTNYAGAVSVSVKTGTGSSGAVLSGTVTVPVADGFAKFTDLTIDKPGTGYVLIATTGTLPPVESLPFNVYAPPTHLVFTTQPDLGEAGRPFQQQPVALARDANNVLIPDYNGPVALGIKAGTGTPGAALTGTSTVMAVNGVATFTDLGINHKGTGYVLEAFVGTSKLGESAPFDVAPKAERLLFRVDPGGAEDDWGFFTQPNVSVVDADGDIATLNRSDITVAIKPGSGTAGASLSGNTTATALHGLAWFTGLGIEKVGAGYVLTASSPGLAPADSMAFDVAEAPKLVLRQSAADEIEVSVHPAGKTIIGASVDLSWDESELAPIRASDVQAASGWHVETLDTAAGCTAVLSSAGTTTNGPILTLHLAAQSGFSGRSASVDLTEFIDLTDDGYNTIPVLPRSAPFIPGAHLAFTRQPVLTTAGQIIAGQPTVAMLDGTQSVVADFTERVSMAIKPGTGASGAVLGGTNSVNATAGIAVFSGLTIDQKGLGYVLLASSGPFTTESLAFDIAPKALKLAFTTQPGNARAGLPMAPQPVVAVQDDDGATAFAFSGPIALAIKPGTGFPGATPAGTATLNAAAGVAAFSDVRIGTAAPGYVLTASGQSLTGAESAAFDVTPFAFTTADVRNAIRWAAGISPVPAGYVGRFDVVPNGVVDLRDAVRIARKAVGLEANP